MGRFSGPGRPPKGRRDLPPGVEPGGGALRNGDSAPSDGRARVSSAADRHEPSAAFLSRDRAQLATLVSDLRALPSWSDRGRLLREHLCPPSAYMRQVYAPSSRAPLPALYIWGRCAARGAGSRALDRLPTEILMSPGDRLVPSDSVVTRVVNGSTVLLNTDTGRYFTLDEVGGRAWTVLTSSPSIQDARDRLLELPRRSQRVDAGSRNVDSESQGTGPRRGGAWVASSRTTNPNRDDGPRRSARCPGATAASSSRRWRSSARCPSSCALFACSG